MVAYVIRRLLMGCLVLLAVTFSIFVIFSTIPFDPACVVVTDCGSLTPAQRDEIHHELGVDRPVYVQYAKYVWRVVSHASFGTSWRELPIDSEIADALGVTGSVVLGGVVVLLLLAVPLGTLSAMRPHSLFDRGLFVILILGVAFNPLTVGFVLRKVLAQDLHLFPNGGYLSLTGHTYSHEQVCNPVCHYAPIGGGPAAWAYHLVLPWLTFAAFFLPLYTRVIRARVRETLSEPHVAVARAKGASEWQVLYRHVLRIALLPLTTMVGLEIGGALMASIYIENVFGTGSPTGFAGLGNLTLGTLESQVAGYDLPLVSAIFVTVAGAIVLCNALADVLQASLDPRIRSAAA